MANAKLAEALKKIKWVGIVASILIIICGVLFTAKPGLSTIALSWFMLAVLLVNGVYKIVCYCVAPKELRNGWVLADGIISTLLGALILIEIAVKPLFATLSIIAFMGYLVGFYEIFAGISQLCSLSAVKAAGGSTGWMIFLGIINILCGIFVTAYPIISTFALQLVLGIYLLVFGIILLIECICLPKE